MSSCQQKKYAIINSQTNLADNSNLIDSNVPADGLALLVARTSADM